MTNDDWRDIVAELEKENRRLRSAIQRALIAYFMDDPSDIIANAMYDHLKDEIKGT